MLCKGFYSTNQASVFCLCQQIERLREQSYEMVHKQQEVLRSSLQDDYDSGMVDCCIPCLDKILKTPYDL